MFMLLFSIVTFAQTGDDSDTGDLEGEDLPAASINKKLIILAIVGIMFVFYKLKSSLKTAELK